MTDKTLQTTFYEWRKAALTAILAFACVSCVAVFAAAQPRLAGGGVAKINTPSSDADDMGCANMAGTSVVGFGATLFLGLSTRRRRRRT